MKILKPGRVERRKFVCHKCGCVFVADLSDVAWQREYTEAIPMVKCPCRNSIWWSDGERCGEPERDDSRQKLIWLIQNFRATNLETADCEADFLIANGVTFREEG